MSVTIYGDNMDILDQYKERILKINEFVQALDPAVRAEAFKFLIGQGISPRHSVPNKNLPNHEEKPDGRASAAFERLSVESGIPAERLMEVYSISDSEVQVVDSSIPNNGPTDLVKKITLLCAYGNIVGRKIVKLDRPTVYRNLKALKAHTTAYSRDVKHAEGVKVLADGLMLLPDGKEKAQALLKEILGLHN